MIYVMLKYKLRLHFLKRIFDSTSTNFWSFVFFVPDPPFAFSDTVLLLVVGAEVNLSNPGFEEDEDACGATGGGREDCIGIVLLRLILSEFLPSL